MCKIVVILLSFLGVIICERVDIASTQSDRQREVGSMCREQISSYRHLNIDAEQTPPTVVPSARTTISNNVRQCQQRLLHFILAERFATNTNYPVSQDVHRLDSYLRVVDYYLYMFCQLRL